MISAAIPHLPNEWPLAKIDLILQNTDKYYMSWRRFLFVHELLRAFNEKAAVNVLRTNATSLVEHLVEFLSEWIVAFLEPAREVTKVRDPELLFLHEKDYWFRAIWQDIHLAATLDRVKSRDRPPVGLVRCICKDARSRGEEGTGSWTPVKLGVSNVHIFVPIWMIPEPVRHVRLLASRDIQPKTSGWVEYKEGWFEIRRSEATAESTLCGLQIHYGDQYIDPFPTDEWKLIERFAQEGLLKQEVWSSRLQWLGVKAKIEIPLSGTGFNVRQNTLHIENLPESWPMDTESAWRERFCKVDFTFQDIVEHLQEECFTDDIFEGYENTKAFRWIAVFNEFWPQGHLDYATLWKGNTVPQLPPKSRHKITQQQLDDILLYAPGKGEYRMPVSPFMELLYRESDMSTAPPQQWLLYERRNHAAEMRKQLTGLMFELCQTFSGSECDKIMDLLVTQCHGRLQQYVDNMQLMIHHTIAAAMQLGINPVTQRVDPATLTGPARTIAQALLREAPDLDPSWMHDPLA